MTIEAGEITELLRAWRSGDDEALGRVMPMVYERLRRIAHAHMRGEHTGHPLQTTALVHEVYLRLTNAAEIEWRDRTHFYAVCAQMMRRILLDIARERRAAKRGGGALHIELGAHEGVAEPKSIDIIDLDEALVRLADFDPRKARLVELRFFGGLEIKEAAEVLGVSEETVSRDWRLAKAWLLRELTGDRNADAI
jgi:RNA polymerase sigma factor (TIGR02999 family)